MERLTAVQVSEYQSFGGNFFDSVSHASLFRDDSPYHFGVMTSRLFSSVDNLGLTNKRWMYLTMASGNYEVLPAGKEEYTWGVVGDADIDLRITKKYVTNSDQVGKNNVSFLVGVDRDWYGEPVYLKTEDDNAPLLEIVGRPRPDGPNNFTLELKVQDGNTNTWINPLMLDVGKTLVRASTLIASEENTKYGEDAYASMVNLRSQIGRSADKVEFTDRFIKMELSAAGKSTSNKGTYKDTDGMKYRDAFSRGHIYQASLSQPGQNKEIQKGFFISVAEQRLLERVETDINNICEWGRWQTTLDRDSKRVKRAAPGWRQLVRDGQYFPHGGYFTLEWLVDKLHSVLYRRRRFKNRKPMLVTGTGGFTFISQLIANYAPTPVTVEPGFNVRRNPNPAGVHEFEYEAGFQFTRFKGPMGVDIAIMYDPSKDDGRYYKQKAPGSFLPLESFAIDILDFGETEDSAENTKGTNITMVTEDMSDYYFSVANAIDYKGIVKDGSNVYNFGKKLEIYREKSGALAIWDIFACGRIEWVVTT